MPEKPQLSIIVASYDSGNLIKSCLESLKNQNTDQPFEIIVVSSSSDGVANLIKQTFPDVRLYQFPKRKFCGDARNIGLSVAKGELIAFIDADCRADQNWANQIIKAHQSPPLAIGGAIANGNPESPVGWAAYFCEFSQWMPGFPIRNMADIAGANMSYKKKAFEEYGLFIEGTYSSDTEFHWRLEKNGRVLQFVPSILVFHHNIDQLGKFLRHEFEHGRYFARVRMNSQYFSKSRRWIYTTFSFLIPPWLFLKIGLNNLKNRNYLPHFLKAWPLLMLGLISWSLGEWVAYLLGSGDQTFIRPKDPCLCREIDGEPLEYESF
jgi:glycosyltransferase involved in cell wall biosynthesis